MENEGQGRFEEKWESEIFVLDIVTIIREV